MTTVYTFNNKVLKNIANDKWLIKATPVPTPTPTFDEVTIGSQTWMSSNLAIDDGGEGITISDNIYYYTKAAAQRVATSVQGWHLPSSEECNTLITNGGGFDGLASSNNWTSRSGTNSSGFTALPYGYIPANNSDVTSAGTRARFWSDTNSDFINMTSMMNQTGCNVSSNTDLSNRYNVRLIKDT